MSSLPSHIYYQACVGAWSSPISLRVTDVSALSASEMSWADQLSVRLMAVWPRWLGVFTMETTVAFDPIGVVAHTTAVRWLGMTLMQSVETITLASDGHSFVVEGSQRVAPALWVSRSLSGSGTISGDAVHADYEFRWLGIMLRQRTDRDRDVVTLHQHGPGFEGVQRLARRAF
jgi:hypothetical protein